MSEDTAIEVFIVLDVYATVVDDRDQLIETRDLLIEKVTTLERHLTFFKYTVCILSGGTLVLLIFMLFGGR